LWLKKSKSSCCNVLLWPVLSSEAVGGRESAAAALPLVPEGVVGSACVEGVVEDPVVAWRGRESDSAALPPVLEDVVVDEGAVGWIAEVPVAGMPGRRESAVAAQPPVRDAVLGVARRVGVASPSSLMQPTPLSAWSEGAKFSARESALLGGPAVAVVVAVSPPEGSVAAASGVGGSPRVASGVSSSCKGGGGAVRLVVGVAQAEAEVLEEPGAEEASILAIRRAESPAG
jgi:hypothetical protein